jgi:hypothetical protein
MTEQAPESESLERTQMVISLMEMTCEAIAVNATADRRWVSRIQIKKYFDDFCPHNPKKVGPLLPKVFDDLVKHNVLLRAKNSYTFQAADTAEMKNASTKRAKPKREESSKQLGLDVVLTQSGRISYRPRPA